MEILTIIFAITTVLFIRMWYSTGKRAEKSLKEMQAQLTSAQSELNTSQNWERKYKELDHAYKVQGEQLKSTWERVFDYRKLVNSYQNKDEPKTDLEKIAEWASANAVITPSKSKKITPSYDKPSKSNQKSTSDNESSSSSVSTWNDYSSSDSNYSSSNSSSSSSSDSYSGGGGDFGGGGSGGDW